MSASSRAVSEVPGAEDDVLTIDFVGEVHELRVGDSLTFGRRADLHIDDNPYLHRVVGRFVERQGLWWLQNHGSRIALELRDVDSPARYTVLPGQQVAVVAQKFLVGFSAGQATYELEGHRSGMALRAEDEALSMGTATVDFGVVPLSAEQHLLLVALSERRLTTGEREVATNQAVADRLGWTITKFNRKLDHLCAKLAREGVRGLRGGPDGLALDRRLALVEHAVDVRLVTSEDLGLL